MFPLVLQQQIMCQRKWKENQWRNMVNESHLQGDEKN
jgi:hypothetical protein